MNLASLSVCETAWHPPTYSSLRSDSAHFSRPGSAELAGTQVARVAIPGGGTAENCSLLHALPTSQPRGCCGWRRFVRPKLAGQQKPCTELCSPGHPRHCACSCSRAAASHCCRLQSVGFLADRAPRAGETEETCPVRVFSGSYRKFPLGTWVPFSVSVSRQAGWQESCLGKDEHW